MRRLAAVLLMLLATVGVARGQPAHEGPARIELYTMGPGNDLFESFGHGTLCVINDKYPSGACYNYGTTDFRDPVRLVWNFLRGRARFWVSRMPLPLMISAYSEQDRTIYRQAIPLSGDAAEQLAAMLENDTRPENKYYVYNHYVENCTTRLRDYLNIASNGELAQGADVPTGQTWRDVTLRGFAIDIRLLVGMEFLVGRAVDTRMTLWNAMFLPDVLRSEVQKRLHADVEVVNVRRAPIPNTPPLAGRWLVLAVAGALTVLNAFAAILGRPRLWRFVRHLDGLVLGAIGALVYVTALVVTLVELRRNEVLLVCLPTDFLLLVLTGRALWVYLVARLALIVVVAVALLAGALIQPMLAALALVAGPLTVAAVRELQNARRPPQEAAVAGGGSSP